jgi:hypothetical protein
MRVIITCLFLCGLAFAEGATPYEFPTFDPTDLIFENSEAKNKSESNVPLVKTDIPYFEKSLNELRAIMTYGKNSERYQAAVTLIQAGDQKTILRVIYSLKQGNPKAEHLLNESPSRQIIPYLMEEVAHGSMEDYSENWMNIITGRVRLTATEIVADTLGQIEDFPEETKRWLDYVRFGDATVRSDNLSEKSKFLVEWWIVNEKAFLAEKWDQIIPVPNAGSYTIPKPVVLQDAALDVLPEFKPPQPWKFKPLEVSESFEEWSARIVHPERRDLSWVELTLVDGEWIPHPPKRLDPLAAPSSPSRTIKRPAVEGKSPLVAHQSPMWIAFFIFVLGLLFWLWSKRSETA